MQMRSNLSGRATFPDVTALLGASGFHVLGKRVDRHETGSDVQRLDSSNAGVLSA
jgi:hypothetical protein